MSGGAQILVQELARLPNGKPFADELRLVRCDYRRRWSVLRLEGNAGPL